MKVLGVGGLAFFLIRGQPEVFSHFLSRSFSRKYGVTCEVATGAFHQVEEVVFYC